MKPIRPIIVAVCLTIILTAIVEAQQTKKKAQTKSSVEHISAPETKSQNLPFSDVVRVGNMLYL